MYHVQNSLEMSGWCKNKNKVQEKGWGSIGKVVPVLNQASCFSIKSSYCFSKPSKLEFWIKYCDDNFAGTTALKLAW